MNKWIAEFELEDGDTMPEHMDLNYKGAKIDFHCKPLEKEPKIKVLDYDEVATKLGTVDIYQARAWITLLKDLEYLGMKICEVEE